MSTSAGENVKILIDIYKFSLQLMEKGKVIRSFPVAVGAKETPSPVGEYRIIHKDHWGGAFGTRWMGLDVPWGTYGIHGTIRPKSIGHAVSHGCIRMFNHHVEELYEKVGIDTKVIMIGPIYKQTLVQGSAGRLVQLVQEKLAEFGIYTGNIDGKFGADTEEAILLLQKSNSLLLTGQVRQAELDFLGINP
jgi:hypothetical protein